MDSRVVGIPASPGIVVGPVHLLVWEVPDVRYRIIPDEEVDGEIARLHEALARARERIMTIRARAEGAAGSDAAIFDVQHAILLDPSVLGATESLIRQNYAAEKAFDIVLTERTRDFARHDAAMMREHVGDLTDVHIRVLSILLGLPDHDPVSLPPGADAILVTHDLTPTLTVQLDRGAIAGIATDAGTRTSHVAILARSLGLPAVVGLRDATSRLRIGQRVVLDGYEGVLVVNPSDAEVEAYKRRAVREAEDEAELRLLAGAESVTLDGVPVVLSANVDLPDEAEAAATSGAVGVGLMRTEFLVVGRATMPDEDEQYRAYARVIEAFPGQPVVIRTFDVGGDKLPVGGYPAEANPFLGWRAIRMCLDEPELFKVQMRALLRASLHGDVRIMLPLIVSYDEVLQTKRLLAESRAELDARGVRYKPRIPLGVMVETPAAAVAVDTFAGEVDFLSIGTNDLVQYTLAVDRGNANLASRFTALHPAVLRLIRRTVEAGREYGIEVCVCGEMASQPLMAFALIGLGLRHLSVAPRAVAVMKKLIRGVSVEIATEAAEAALIARTAAAAELALSRRLHAAFGDASFLRTGLPAMSEGNIISQLEPS